MFHAYLFFVFIYLRMDKFSENLKNIKLLKLKYQTNKSLSNTSEMHSLINSNDKLVETGNINNKILSQYIDERRECINIFVTKQMEALRRKNALQNIEEDAEHFIRLNEYIKILLEENANPVDNLLCNLENSEIYLEESNKNLERYKKRWLKCSTLKKIGRILLLLIFVLYLCKIISMFN